MTLPELGANDVLYVVGDVHGDLNQFLHPLKAFINDTTHDNKWLVYIGDYIDRGEYDAYIYCLINAVENTDFGVNAHVIFLRGNHEEIKTNPDLYTRFRYKGPTTFNGHFQQNVSFVWELMNNKHLPIYFLMKCVNEVLVFTHAPVYTAKDCFQVDESLGILTCNSKPFPPCPESDIIELYNNEIVNFTTINKTTRTNNQTLLQSYNSFVSPKSYPNQLNVVNVFGHVHADDTLFNGLFTSYAHINNESNESLQQGGDNVKGFICLDVDASYGFRLKSVIWNNDKNCDKHTRNNFMSNVNYAKLTYADDWQIIRNNPSLTVSDTSNLNFNKVKSLDELRQMLMINNIHINEDELLKSYHTVCKYLLIQINETNDNTTDWDEFVFENYVKEFNKSLPEFQRLIDLKRKEITNLSKDALLQRPTMDWFVKLFNNVPADMIHSIGMTTKYTNERPFEIFCQAINERILNDDNEYIKYAWCYYNDDSLQPSTKLNAGYKNMKCQKSMLFMLLFILVVVVVVVIIVVIVANSDSNFGEELFCSKCEEIKRKAEQSPEGVYY